MDEIPDDLEDKVVWQAVMTVRNNEFVGDWKITRIKGNKGDKGEDGQDGKDGKDGKDGTSITVRGRYDSYEEFIAEHPTGEEGDAYSIDGDLYIWVEDDPEGYWLNAGRFKGDTGEKGDKGDTGENGADGKDGVDGLPGENGKTPVLVVKYAIKKNDTYEIVDPTVTVPTHIGTYVNYEGEFDPENIPVSDFTWTEFKGKDGLGYEFIFFATDDETTVPEVVISTTDKRNDAHLKKEYKPIAKNTTPKKRWEDDIPSLEFPNRVIWCLSRKQVSDDLYENYEDKTPAIFSSLGKDGADAINRFKATAFYAAPIDVVWDSSNLPTGGDWDNPTPSNG